MRPTAKQYGLRINNSYDGRRDVIDATDAALTFLLTCTNALMIGSLP